MSSAVPPPSVVALLRMAWEEGIAEVHDGLVAAGYGDVRPAHLNVLRDVLTAALRPTELAARLGLSKQAANDVLRELEAGGYIMLVADPDDGRAKRIQPTARGTALVATASRLSGAIAERWATRVGEDRFAVVERVLREITDGTAA